MTKVFIGGSRHVSRFPATIVERLETIISKGHHVLLGDANGADKAAQKHFASAGYEKVTIYCSGATPRNHLADWPVENVIPAKGMKGFQFYAAKDRRMAEEADFGLMIWDGKSPGTVLNVLRLVQAGKIAVLANVPERKALNVKTHDDWSAFLIEQSLDFRADLRERATPEEWDFAEPAPQLGLSLDSGLEQRPRSVPTKVDKIAANAMNAALTTGDVAQFVDALGNVARAHGMSQIARETGLSRESLYRSLADGGNPEFATIIKVMSSLGLTLNATTTPR